MNLSKNALSVKNLNAVFEEAEIQCPDIAFGMILQAYAGLRCTEVVSLFNKHHPDGGSIKQTNCMVLVSCGLKSTIIPDEFAMDVITAYEKHLEYVGEKCVDSRYPLFINSNGTALSVDRYIRRVKAYGDIILNSDNPSLTEVRAYLRKVNGRFTGDMLRHWYAMNIMDNTLHRYNKDKN
jgi:hypothetical protein